MKAFGRHGRALLIIAALWLLNELIAMLVQGSYQQDTLLGCRCILLFVFGMMLHDRHRTKSTLPVRALCVLIAAVLLCLQLQLIPFLRTDIIIGFIESQTLSIALLDIYLGYVAAA